MPEPYWGTLTLRIIFACRNRYMCVKDRADRNRWLAAILNMKVFIFVAAFIYIYTDSLSLSFVNFLPDSSSEKRETRKRK